MTTVKQGLIPYNKANAMKCMCGSCPIHKESSCVRQVVERLSDHLELLDKEPLVKEEIPGLYCAGGKASCGDLNYRNPCVCGTCPIFNEVYHLADDKPGGYFCRGGQAT